MSIELEIQRLVDDPGVPADPQIESWVQSVLADAGDVSVNLRIVDEAEGWALNKQWRGRDSATNVLSFPADVPAAGGSRVLGDVVVCAPVVAREAVEHGKPLANHWAHLIVHGLLHLQGYDHIDGEHAEVMEAREVEILAGLGIPDPYEVSNES
jgi:probable rRNA maturation factor